MFDIPYSYSDLTIFGVLASVSAVLLLDTVIKLRNSFKNAFAKNGICSPNCLIAWQFWLRVCSHCCMLFWFQCCHAAVGLCRQLERSNPKVVHNKLLICCGFNWGWLPTAYCQSFYFYISALFRINDMLLANQNSDKYWMGIAYYKLS